MGLVVVAALVFFVWFSLFKKSGDASASPALRSELHRARVSPHGQVLEPIPYGGDLTVSEQTIRDAVREAFGPGKRGQISKIHRDVGGGVINAVFRVSLANREEVWVKFGSPFWDGCGKLHSNAALLRYLRKHTTLPVPEPLAVLDRIPGKRTEVLILSNMGGRKLATELLRPTNEVSQDSRKLYYEAWANVFAQLKGISFSEFGSFAPDPKGASGDEGSTHLEVGPLLSNGGCSGLGPFQTYVGYAAARVQMFLPLVKAGVCNAQFTPLLKRMECLATTFREYLPPEQGTTEDFVLKPVILHSDLSARNLLVSGGAADDQDGPPRVTAVLDWEFAVAGLAEEEITFPASLESHATDADTAIIKAAFKKNGIVAPKGSATRSDHVSAYWQLIIACHSAAWKDDPTFDHDAREAMVATAKQDMENILVRNSC